jgi:hypothetical protein
MMRISIPRMTKGAHEEKKRNNTIDHPIFFSLSSFPPFSLLSLRCKRPSLSTIKGEIGAPCRALRDK